MCKCKFLNWGRGGDLKLNSGGKGSKLGRWVNQRDKAGEKAIKLGSDKLSVMGRDREGKLNSNSEDKAS